MLLNPSGGAGSDWSPRSGLLAPFAQLGGLPLEFPARRQRRPVAARDTSAGRCGESSAEPVSEPDPSQHPEHAWYKLRTSKLKTVALDKIWVRGNGSGQVNQKDIFPFLSPKHHRLILPGF